MIATVDHPTSTVRRRAPRGADLLAGASVALVLIPQAMAYAELAGVPPQVGLFAAGLPPLLAAPFVSSPYLQTGPVALTALLTFGVLEGSAEPFTSEFVALAALLALLVGVFRLVLGFLRLGSLAYLLSKPVLTGFTTGAAILIVASQLPRALGVAGGEAGVLANAAAAVTDVAQWELSAIVLGGITVALMIGGRRLHVLFPGVLIAVVGSVVLSRLFGYDGSTIGELPGGFLRLRIDFPWSSIVSLVPGAAAIAVVGFAEPSSIARTFAAQERRSWSANQEMLSQGVANVASAISGGIPVGGSFSRSAIGRLAGGHTAWTGAISGLIVLCVLPITPLASPLPRAVLAAIIIVSVFKLIKVASIFVLFAESWPQGVVALGTLAATLASAPRVERGVFVGVGLAIAVHLYRELNITSVYEIEDTMMTVRPQGVLWFATVPQIERLVRNNLADHPDITTVHFDLGGVGRLDYTGAATLSQTIGTLASAGVSCALTNVPPGAQRAARIHCPDSISPQTASPS